MTFYNNNKTFNYLLQKVFQGSEGEEEGRGGGVASFNLLLCIKYQLMWQPMDGHLQPRIPHGRGMCQLCFASLWFGLVWFGIVQYGAVWFGM